MADTEKIHIIGIGDDGADGITSRAKTLIDEAQLLIGPPFILKLFDGQSSECWDAGDDIEALANRLNSAEHQKVVILTPGDPLFYGTARYLCDRLGKDRFEVLPHVSTMQLAFARVKETWNEAYLTNLATHSLTHVINKIRNAERVGVFTASHATPADLANALLDAGIDYFTAYVCENLGTPDEVVTQGDLQSIRDQKFGSMNVMVLVRRSGSADRPSGSKQRRLFGNPDDLFIQSRPKRGLITPSEVRCIALSELSLQADSIVWAVGAGSGSLAIEAAAIACKGKVFAIEMDAEDFALMIENARMFDVPGLVPIHGQAPEAFNELPDPDAIFIGGSGRMVPDLVQAALSRMKPGASTVVNVSSPDNLVAVQTRIDQAGLRSDVRMINIARGQYQLDRVRFDALNPTFLVLGRHWH